MSYFDPNKPKPPPEEIPSYSKTLPSKPAVPKKELPATPQNLKELVNQPLSNQGASKTLGEHTYFPAKPHMRPLPPTPSSKPTPIPKEYEELFSTFRENMQKFINKKDEYEKASNQIKPEDRALYDEVIKRFNQIENSSAKVMTQMFEIEEMVRAKVDSSYIFNRFSDLFSSAEFETLLTDIIELNNIGMVANLFLSSKDISTSPATPNVVTVSKLTEQKSDGGEFLALMQYAVKLSILFREIEKLPQSEVLQDKAKETKDILDQQLSLMNKRAHSPLQTAKEFLTRLEKGEFNTQDNAAMNDYRNNIGKFVNRLKNDAEKSKNGDAVKELYRLVTSNKDRLLAFIDKSDYIELKSVLSKRS